MTTETPGVSSYHLNPDEKVSNVMIYTADHLIWGDVITKTGIRVSTWLRSQAIPQYIFLHNANILRFSVSGALKPQFYKGLHIPSAQVIAFHLKPPASDPIDYDAQEPMRKMSPTLALVGWFRFEFTMRMSTHTDLERFLDVTKEAFTGVYDVVITNLAVPNMSIIRVPFAMIRGNAVMFSSKED
jgi:hypothetical protein